MSCADELEMEFGTDDNTAVAEKSKQTLSKKPSSENKSKANKLVQGEEDKIEAAAAAFPSKLVAMHKVRWNLNQGSENLLCFGGAAGILRCQEIDINNT